MTDTKLLSAKELDYLRLCASSYVLEPARMLSPVPIVNGMAEDIIRLLDHIAALELHLAEARQMIATAREVAVRLDAEARMARLKQRLAEADKQLGTAYLYKPVEHKTPEPEATP